MDSCGEKGSLSGSGRRPGCTSAPSSSCDPRGELITACCDRSALSWHVQSPPKTPQSGEVLRRTILAPSVSVPGRHFGRTRPSQSARRCGGGIEARGTLAFSSLSRRKLVICYQTSSRAHVKLNADHPQISAPSSSGLLPGISLPISPSSASSSVPSSAPSSASSSASSDRGPFTTLALCAFELTPIARLSITSYRDDHINERRWNRDHLHGAPGLNGTRGKQVLVQHGPDLGNCRRCGWRASLTSLADAIFLLTPRYYHRESSSLPACYS